jgi:hypothetical protein
MYKQNIQAMQSRNAAKIKVLNGNADVFLGDHSSLKLTNIGKIALMEI